MAVTGIEAGRKRPAQDLGEAWEGCFWVFFGWISTDKASLCRQSFRSFWWFCEADTDWYVKGLSRDDLCFGNSTKNIIYESSSNHANTTEVDSPESTPNCLRLMIYFFTCVYVHFCI